MAMKIISPVEFAEWLATAKRGDRLTYYLGFLCHDRSYERTIAPNLKETVVNKPLDNLAAAVWEAYENRRVIPVQSKLTNGVYEYLVVRT